jgi:glycosyltransferase 2 family protein
LNPINFSHFLKKYFYKILTNKWVHLVGYLVSLIFCSLFIIRNFQNISIALQSSHLNVLILIEAWALTLITVFLGAVAWWFTLRGFKARADFWPTIRIHLLTSISKYIPGYAWPFLNKGFQTSQQGIPVQTIGIALLWEFLQNLWTGISICLITFPKLLFERLNYPLQWIIVGPVLGVILFLLPLIFFTINPYWFSQKKGPENQVDVKWLYASFGIVCLGWFLLGTTLNLFIVAFNGASPNLLIYLTFTFTVSLLIGIMVILVPNGLGIREGIMVFFLSQVTSIPTAILIAALSRLAITSNDLLGAVICRLFKANSLE